MVNGVHEQISFVYKYFRFSTICHCLVDFNDYNADVLNEITIPNVLLNVPNGSQTETRNVFFVLYWVKYVFFYISWPPVSMTYFTLRLINSNKKS